MPIRASLLGLSLVLMVAALPAQDGERPRPDQPSSQVNGLEIFLDRDGEAVPGPTVEVDARERYVTIRARAAKWVGADKVEVTDWKLELARWVVVTVGQVPVKVTEDLDGTNANVIVGLPEAGEGLLVYVCATLRRDNGGTTERTMTRHALLTIKVSGKAAPAGRAAPAAPQDANPVAVPAGVTGLSVVMVSREAPGQELLDLLASERVKAELARSKSAAYLYYPGAKAPFDLARRPDLLAVMKDGQGREITGAGLVVITSDGKSVLPAGRGQRLVYLRYDGRSDKETLARNEAILIDMVGRAAGGK